MLHVCHTHIALSLLLACTTYYCNHDHVCTYVYLISTTEYKSNNVHEDAGSSTSNAAIVATTSSVTVFMLIVAAVMIIILLRYWSRIRWSHLPWSNGT